MRGASPRCRLEPRCGLGMSMKRSSSRPSTGLPRRTAAPRLSTSSASRRPSRGFAAMSAAASGYRDAMRRYRELKLDLDLGLMAIDMVYVLGPDDSLTMEAVAAARSRSP